MSRVLNTYQLFLKLGNRGYRGISGFENYLLAGHLVSIGFDGSAAISIAAQ